MDHTYHCAFPNLNSANFQELTSASANRTAFECTSFGGITEKAEFKLVNCEIKKKNTFFLHQRTVRYVIVFSKSKKQGSFGSDLLRMILRVTSKYETNSIC